MVILQILASVKDAEEEQAVVLINYAIAVLVNKNSVKFASAFYSVSGHGIVNIYKEPPDSLF